MNNLYTEQLRKAEEEIDEYYKTNPLLKLSRSEALWYLFAEFEENFIRNGIKYEDNLINSLKWSARWLFKDCSTGGKFKIEYNDKLYEAAHNLLGLSDNYLSFESIFSYWGWEKLNLKIKDNIILTSGIIRKDSCYDAYDRIYIDDNEEINKALEYDIKEFNKLIQPIIKIKNDNFSYKLNPKLIKDVKKLVIKNIEIRFNLPSGWKITDYTIGEYKLVLQMLWIISKIHYELRLIAMSNGCLGLGYKNALVIMGKSELINRLSRYTKLEHIIVQNIINDITLGYSGIKNPDPALQPIFEFTENKLAWAPNLIINSNLERNLIVLINRFLKGKELYSKLSNHKEKILQDKIKTDLNKLNFRYWNGNVSEWGNRNDIDFAIISDDEKCCLLLELKSFIRPSEPREVYEKSEEIERGIKQIKERKGNAKKPLYDILNINEEYSIYWAVASKTSIGACYIQDDEVPVIGTSHLTSQINKMNSLTKIGEWLKSRAYLPVEGKDYEEVETKKTIGKWTAEWYGLNLI